MILTLYTKKFIQIFDETFALIFIPFENSVADNTRIAKLLIDLGSDPNLPDKDGDTPLHIASRYGVYDFHFIECQNTV